MPTSTNKLESKWQGLYLVEKHVGKVDYHVKMHDRKKKNRIFHVNMLQKWNAREPSMDSFLCDEEILADDIPVWKDRDNEQVELGENLSKEERADLTKLLREYRGVFQSAPGKTTLIEHRIKTETAQLIRLPSYEVPQAYRDTVKKELDEMLSAGIVEPSSSEWSAPIVLVKKKINYRDCVSTIESSTKHQKVMHTLCQGLMSS